MMDTKQLAEWRYLIVLAKDPKIKSISLGSNLRRGVLIAVDEEMTRMYEENKELKSKLAGLKTAADCLGGGE